MCEHVGMSVYLYICVCVCVWTLYVVCVSVDPCVSICE